jgi:hypothetical protein
LAHRNVQRNVVHVLATRERLQLVRTGDHVHGVDDPERPEREDAPFEQQTRQAIDDCRLRDRRPLLQRSHHPLMPDAERRLVQPELVIERRQVDLVRKVHQCRERRRCSLALDGPLERVVDVTRDRGLAGRCDGKRGEQQSIGGCVQHDLLQVGRMG